MNLYKGTGLFLIMMVLIAGCDPGMSRERHLIEEAQARAEEAMHEAQRAQETATEGAFQKADEARERAEDAWEKASEARMRLAYENQERLDDQWERAENARDDAEDAWEDAENTFEDHHDGMDAFAASMKHFGERMKALGNALDEDRRVEPIEWRKLRDLLPERVAGMRRHNVDGERTESGGLGVRLSKVKAEYYEDDDNARLTMAIVDLGSLKRVAMMGLSWLDLEIDHESNDGFERTSRYKDFPTFEKCERDHHCEMKMIVGERFLVAIESEGKDRAREHLIAALKALHLDDLSHLNRDGA